MKCVCGVVYVAGVSACMTERGGGSVFLRRAFRVDNMVLHFGVVHGAHIGLRTVHSVPLFLAMARMLDVLKVEEQWSTQIK